MCPALRDPRDCVTSSMIGVTDVLISVHFNQALMRLKGTTAAGDTKARPGGGRGGGGRLQLRGSQTGERGCGCRRSASLLRNQKSDKESPCPHWDAATARARRLHDPNNNCPYYRIPWTAAPSCTRISNPWEATGVPRRPRNTPGP
ncbi:hypothetical protein E2C01_091259 [Portunus trituberculatus]|uniref:Uncharacterized protein n=1 Tax=Portunus trituberculatus TaxID=210409 RepID=A0A5B7JNJ6_PORTR|nr:hypothetical protein [Portunus trituberculatus]